MNQPNELPPSGQPGQPPQNPGQQWPPPTPPGQYPGGQPSYPSYPTPGQQPGGYGWQQPPPAGHQSWGYPTQPGYPGGPGPRKSKTPLVIGIIVAVLVLIGLVVGGILLATHGDDSGDDKSSSDNKPTASPKPTKTTKPPNGGIENVTAACPLMDASFVTEEASKQGSIPDLTSQEENPESFGNGTEYKCTYLTSNGQTFMDFSVTIFQEGAPAACTPQECIDRIEQNDEQPLTGIGDAAVFYKGAGGVGGIAAAKDIDNHSVVVILTGPGPNADANFLSPFVKEILRNLE